MKVGVVYKFKKQKKINGTLFYCFEYYNFLKKLVNAKFYIVGIDPPDLELVKKIFAEKYTADVNSIIPVRVTELYGLQLDRTLVLDVKTFDDCKEFLTNEVHCYSNDTHSMFRYQNSRTVTYYGSYPFQQYDVFTYLKFNFDIFKPRVSSAPAVFISCIDQKYLDDRIGYYQEQFQRPIITKKFNSGIGNIFDYIDSLHYVHVVLDKNNRMIPEAFYYNCAVTIEDRFPVTDSVMLRYNDIVANGLGNYILDKDDAIVQALTR